MASAQASHREVVLRCYWLPSSSSHQLMMKTHWVNDYDRGKWLPAAVCIRPISCCCCIPQEVGAREECSRVSEKARKINFLCRNFPISKLAIFRLLVLVRMNIPVSIGVSRICRVIPNCSANYVQLKRTSTSTPRRTSLPIAESRIMQ
jgi:hypothetical protein